MISWKLAGGVVIQELFLAVSAEEMASVIAHELGHNFNAPHTHDYAPPVELDVPPPEAVEGTYHDFWESILHPYFVHAFSAWMRDAIRMEPGGFEPPSRDSQPAASTRLVVAFISDDPQPTTGVNRPSPDVV